MTPRKKIEVWVWEHATETNYAGARYVMFLPGLPGVKGLSGRNTYRVLGYVLRNTKWKFVMSRAVNPGTVGNWKRLHRG